jgi:hypothetical protein
MIDFKRYVSKRAADVDPNSSFPRGYQALKPFF